MELKPTPRWSTDRIALFLLGPEHVVPEYVAWLNDPAVNRFLESRFSKHSEADTREFVVACREHPGTLFLGIRANELGGRHVGNVKIGPIDTHHGLGEIGILIGDRAAWGRGIASDAIAAMCAIAHEQLAVRKATAGCYASNVGSVKAFQRAGFEIEGIRRAHFCTPDGLEDLVLMARWLD